MTINKYINFLIKLLTLSTNLNKILFIFKWLNKISICEIKDIIYLL